MRAFGLKTWIWNNGWKTALLLAGFPFLLALICFAFGLLLVAAVLRWASTLLRFVVEHRMAVAVLAPLLLLLLDGQEDYGWSVVTRLQQAALGR